MAAANLTLQCEDGQFVTISREAAKNSQLLTDLMEDLSEDEVELPIPIQADKETLMKVVQWCELQIQQEEVEEKVEEEKPKLPAPIPLWAKDFFEGLSQDEAFAVITAANFLDIQLLIQCTAKHIANQIKGMSTEEMREYFHIENDFSPEEEESIRRECEWAMPDKYNDSEPPTNPKF
ncbi:E3 ubiquitin ligase complex SCF subunit scon-3 [Hypoxylon sp. EC38]|nr:E3 ubiquitin ligase complex SCF subunit scon-3 [Hypoxylon sp. EC38]